MTEKCVGLEVHPGSGLRLHPAGALAVAPEAGAALRGVRHDPLPLDAGLHRLLNLAVARVLRERRIRYPCF